MEYLKRTVVSRSWVCLDVGADAVFTFFIKEISPGYI